MVTCEFYTLLSEVRFLSRLRSTENAGSNPAPWPKHALGGKVVIRRTFTYESKIQVYLTKTAVCEFDSRLRPQTWVQYAKGKAGRPITTSITNILV